MKWVQITLKKKNPLNFNVSIFNVTVNCSLKNTNTSEKIKIDRSTHNCDPFSDILPLVALLLAQLTTDAAYHMTTTLTSDSTVVAGKPKENAKTKASGRSGKEKESSKSKAPAKAKLATEVVKKPFKVVVRKLPVRDFNAEDFAKSITRVLSQLGYGTSAPGDETAKDADKEFIRIEHFIEGKLRYKLQV